MMGEIKITLLAMWLGMALPVVPAHAADLQTSNADSLEHLSQAPDQKSDKPDRSSVKTQKYHFVLTKGAGIPVCEAYLERLNTTEYVSPPYCDRPESSTVAGFSALRRVPLSAVAVRFLFPRIVQFMATGRQGNKKQDEAYEALLRRNGVGPSIDPLSTFESFLRHGELKVWGYASPVDIENNGTPDRVVIWQGYGLGSPLGVCGHPLEYGGISTNGAQPQVAFVLDSSGNRLNIRKTRAIFAHPGGGYRLPDGKMAMAFRPIGFHLGVFEYRGTYYFDTFFDSWNDSSNKRKNNTELLNTLGVFLRMNNKTKQVCEYKMTEQNSMEGGYRQ